MTSRKPIDTGRTVGCRFVLSKQVEQRPSIFFADTRDPGADSKDSGLVPWGLLRMCGKSGLYRVMGKTQLFAVYRVTLPLFGRHDVQVPISTLKAGSRRT